MRESIFIIAEHLFPIPILFKINHSGIIARGKVHAEDDSVPPAVFEDQHGGVSLSRQPKESLGGGPIAVI